MRGQTQVRVVDSKQKPVLGARREHPIRLEAAAGDEIVDEDADVRLVAAQDQRRIAARASGCVDACHQPLGRGLLVSGRPVDLAGKKRPLDPVGFERRFEFRRLNEVVFDRVAGSKHDRVAQPGKRLTSRSGCAGRDIEKPFT